MKRILKTMLAILATVMLAGACAPADGVSVGFALTDAPLDASLVTAVNVTVSEVAINESTDGSISDADGSWIAVAIDPPRTINLLDFQNGLADQLGELTIAGGTQINQIRLTVDSVEVVDAGGAKTATLLSTSGLKIVNAFRVPLSGAVTITIDFDVRKSIIELPSGSYKVKPVLRAVIDNEAGQITGTVPTGVVTVYAYENDTYTSEEPVADLSGFTFTGAYTSACVKIDDTYVLAFMDEGIYDLYGVDATGAVVADLADVTVVADDTTHLADLVSTVP